MDKGKPVSRARRHQGSQIGPLRERLMQAAQSEPSQQGLIDLNEIAPHGLPTVGNVYYTPYEQEMLARCLAIVDDQKVTGASILARSNREKADRHNAAALDAMGEVERLDTLRLEIESLPEETDVTAPVEELQVNIPSGPFAGTEERSWTDLWRETCNALEFEQARRRRESEAAGEKFVFSELLLEAIRIRGQQDFERTPKPAVAGAPAQNLPFPRPELLTHYAVTRKKIRFDAVWLPIGQWIINQVEMLPGLGIEAQVDAIRNLMTALMKATEEEAGNGRWVRTYLRKRDANPKMFTPSKFYEVDVRFLGGYLGKPATSAQGVRFEALNTKPASPSSAQLAD